jgi:hypothetical protein
MAPDRRLFDAILVVPNCAVTDRDSEDQSVSAQWLNFIIACTFLRQKLCKITDFRIFSPKTASHAPEIGRVPSVSCSEN